MRVWPWKIGELGYILGYTTHFWGTCSLGQSWFSPDVTWDNDCAIPHYDCAISNYDCAISYLLCLAQNLYLESSISRKSAFIISLPDLLSTLCLLKSCDLTNTKYGKRGLVWA